MTHSERYKQAVIRPGLMSIAVSAVSARIRQNKARYERIEQLTGCPWWVVGCIHMMEAGGKKNPFAGHLHNGDPLTDKTVNVPKGRPLGNPPFSWEASAVDAIQFMERNNRTWRLLKGQWDMESCLNKLEAYNGLGYRRKGVPSPYLWSFTDQYTSGKYVLDGKYDPNAVSKQPGVVAIMKALGI